MSKATTALQDLQPHIQNFSGRSLEDFFSKKKCRFSKVLPEMSLDIFSYFFQRRF